MEPCCPTGSPASRGRPSSSCMAATGVSTTGTPRSTRSPARTGCSPTAGATTRPTPPPTQPQNDGQVYSPKLHADDLAALLAVLGHSPAHIVGAGYGAYV